MSFYYAVAVVLLNTIFVAIRQHLQESCSPFPSANRASNSDINKWHKVIVSVHGSYKCNLCLTLKR